MEWWGTVLCSFGSAIIGGLITGIFSFLVAKSNQKHQDERIEKEKLEKTKKEKPRLEIIDYKGIKQIGEVDIESADASILALGIFGYNEKNGMAQFKYNKKAVSKNDLVFVEYLFKNTGLTEIEDICFSSNIRMMSIFEMERKNFYLKYNLLNCAVSYYNVNVKPDGTFKFRVYYANNQIMTTNLGTPEFTVWLRDINGYYWSQILNAPSKEIEISRLRNWKDYREAIDIKDALNYFRDRD